MFGIEALDVVIGLIFIYLLFSLFVSIVNEMLNSTFNVRGKELAKAIKPLLGYDSITLNEFYSSKEIENLTEDAGPFLIIINWTINRGLLKNFKNKRLPDQISAEQFARAYKEIKSDSSLDADELNRLYEDAMFKASSLYKRKLRRVLFALGLLTAALFNADSIEIFKTLKDNPETRAKIVEQATLYAAQNDSLPELVRMTEADLAALKTALDSLRSQQIDRLNANLGLGWNFEKLKKKDDATLGDYISAARKQSSWMTFWGWVITAIAISLGAPFWFDLLKQVINLKNELKTKPKTD